MGTKLHGFFHYCFKIVAWLASCRNLKNQLSNLQQNICVSFHLIVWPEPRHLIRSGSCPCTGAFKARTKLVDVVILRRELGQITSTMEKCLHVALFLADLRLLIQPGNNFGILLLITTNIAGSLLSGNTQITRETVITNTVSNTEINSLRYIALGTVDLVDTLVEKL